MDSSDDKQGGHFQADMPLPDETGDKTDKSAELAADLARRKLDNLYSKEPKAAEEAADVVLAGDSQTSPHQKFLLELTSSGKSLSEINQAWHEYYAGLPDKQKHEVWQEFYQVHADASRHSAIAPTIIPEPLKYEETPIAMPKKRRSAKPEHPKRHKKTRAAQYSQAASRQRAKLTPLQHLQSILFGLGVGTVVLLIVLFSFFNERFIAPFIQPSRNVSSTPIISDNVIANPNPEIIIPKINVEIPVVYGMGSIVESDVQKALENGVLHYADTAQPGQNGNVVIIGHSAVNIFGNGRYKFAFTLLNRLDNGDTIYLIKDGKRYTYQIYKKTVVKPTDVQVLGSADKSATVSLITCDPPGLNTNRLVVVAEQISPEPAQNIAAKTNQNTVAVGAPIVPGNAPSLWSRFVNWFTQ
jgi:sortase A